MPRKKTKKRNRALSSTEKRNHTSILIGVVATLAIGFLVIQPTPYGINCFASSGTSWIVFSSGGSGQNGQNRMGRGTSGPET